MEVKSIHTYFFIGTHKWSSLCHFEKQLGYPYPMCKKTLHWKHFTEFRESLQYIQILRASWPPLTSETATGLCAPVKRDLFSVHFFRDSFWATSWIIATSSSSSLVTRPSSSMMWHRTATALFVIVEGIGSSSIARWAVTSTPLIFKGQFLAVCLNFMQILHLFPIGFPSASTFLSRLLVNSAVATLGGCHLWN